jgi:hypothetical protein
MHSEQLEGGPKLLNFMPGNNLSDWGGFQKPAAFGGGGWGAGMGALFWELPSPRGVTLHLRLGTTLWTWVR